MLDIETKTNTIYLTRGDSARLDVIALHKLTKEPYIPTEQDQITFYLKRRDADDEPVLIEKDIPYDTMLLTLDPEDTQNLKYGTYTYKIVIIMADGFKDTFIADAKLVLTKEGA